MFCPPSLVAIPVLFSPHFFYVHNSLFGACDNVYDTKWAMWLKNKITWFSYSRNQILSLIWIVKIYHDVIEGERRTFFFSLGSGWLVMRDDVIHNCDYCAFWYKPACFIKMEFWSLRQFMSHFCMTHNPHSVLNGPCQMVSSISNIIYIAQTRTLCMYI